MGAGARCHICARPVDHDRDPYYVETDPGHYHDEQFEVALANHILVRACWSCWMKWPLASKRRVGDLALSERAEIGAQA